MFDDVGWTKEERQECAEWVRERESTYVAQNGRSYPWLNGITTDELIDEILTDAGWAELTPAWMAAQDVLSLHRHRTAKS